MRKTPEEFFAEDVRGLTAEGLAKLEEIRQRSPYTDYEVLMGEPPPFGRQKAILPEGIEIDLTKLQRPPKVEAPFWQKVPTNPEAKRQFEGFRSEPVRGLLLLGSVYAVCSRDWYEKTRRFISALSTRMGVPQEIIALQTAALSAKTPVDENLFLAAVWDLEPYLVGRKVIEAVKPQSLKRNLEKVDRIREIWQTIDQRIRRLVAADKQDKVRDIAAKGLLYRLTRWDGWEVLSGLQPDELQTLRGLHRVFHPKANPQQYPVMLAKTGNFALNLAGATGVATIDTHMFKILFGRKKLPNTTESFFYQPPSVYQDLAEDYAEYLASEAGKIRQQYPLLTTWLRLVPEELQSVVWVMRQVADQDFSRPIPLPYLRRTYQRAINDPKFREALETEIQNIINSLGEVREGSKKAEYVSWLKETWLEPLQQVKTKEEREAIDKAMDDLSFLGFVYHTEQVQKAPEVHFFDPEATAAMEAAKATPVFLSNLLKKMEERKRPTADDIALKAKVSEVVRLGRQVQDIVDSDLSPEEKNQELTHLITPYFTAVKEFIAETATRWSGLSAGTQRGVQEALLSDDKTAIREGLKRLSRLLRYIQPSANFKVALQSGQVKISWVENGTRMTYTIPP